MRKSKAEKESLVREGRLKLIALSYQRAKLRANKLQDEVGQVDFERAILVQNIMMVVGTRENRERSVKRKQVNSY